MLANNPTAEPARTPHVKIVSVSVNRPLWNNARAITSPSTRKAAADGITKNAMRRNPAFNRARRSAAVSDSLPITLDISGSSAAEIDIPNRLTGSV